MFIMVQGRQDNMRNKGDSKVFIGFVLTLITGLIGYSMQHYFNLQERQAELWNQTKLKAYTEFIESQGISDSARYRLGLLGSPKVIVAAGNYEKSLMIKAEKAVRHHTATALFHAMRKDISSGKSDLSSEQSEHLEWVMRPNYMHQKLQGGSKDH